MDLNDIELIDVQALGGVDSAVLNDVSRDRPQVRSHFDLEAAIGGGAGDGAADSVTVNGTNDPDEIEITADEERRGRLRRSGEASGSTTRRPQTTS